MKPVRQPFNPLSHRGYAAAAQQQGAALVVVLLLLLIITVLGLASMRGTLMQERMAGAAYARSVAFNGAEAALRVGEAIAANRPTVPTSGCAAGLCARPVPGDAPVWNASGFWNSAATGDAALGSEYHGVEARYIVEHLGTASTNCSPQLANPVPCSGTGGVYRVTARAISPNGAEVILQSTYRVQ